LIKAKARGHFGKQSDLPSVCSREFLSAQQPMRRLC
jgi:hypothetical protein